MFVVVFFFVFFAVLEVVSTKYNNAFVFFFSPC